MQRTRAIVALLVVQVLFGGFPVAGKSVFVHISPVQLMAVRVVAAAAVLILLERALVHGGPSLAPKWRLLMLLTLLGVVVNQTLFLMGLERTSATHASLAITTIPVMTYGVAVLMGRETWGPRRLLGILVAMAGAALLVLQGGISGGWDHALGDLMILTNCASFSLYLVLSKPLLVDHHPLSVTAWTFGLGALLMLPVAFMTGGFATAASLPENAMWWLAFIVAGPSVGTYVLNAFALRHVAASTVAAFIFLQPTITALLAAWLLDEALTWWLVPPTMLVAAGVWLVAIRPGRRAVMPLAA